MGVDFTLIHADHYLLTPEARHLESKCLGVLPYIGYTSMCRWKGYGFQGIWSGIGSSNHRKLV